jgi:hypothetical protein
MNANASIHAAGDGASQRFHGLDALRAWAMSLGIVLHAAWIMTPGEAGAPSTDASASPFCGYIADAIHMFRMQLFFLLAGFFACLLVRKRGVTQFAWNRVLRIAIPFLLFWAFLRPLMMWQFSAAKIRSGDLQTDETAWQTMLASYDNFSAETFLTMHLWFVWYLMVIYVLVLAARGLILLLDRSGSFRNGISSRFGVLATSVWAPLVLTLFAAPLMFLMDDLSGIEMDPWSLYPKWPGLLSYLVYFVVGWLMYRNLDRFSAMLVRWKWQLAAGVLLTVPFFFAREFALTEGYATPAYPALTVADVRYDHSTQQRDYPKLREQLVGAKDGSLAAGAWDLIPEDYQRFLQEHPSATENQLNGLVTALSQHVISAAEWTRDADLSTVALSETAMSIASLPAEQRSPYQVQRLNREVLESALPGSFYSEDVNRPHFHAVRAGYSLYYTATTWLLIFGCLGFSQYFFTTHSFFWRYFSDAAYWMYLMHLLVQFQILLWVGDQPWHWILKFTFYVVGTCLVLVPTYHLLVRPTRLGWLLSGRTYPIRFSSPAQGESLPTVSEPLAAGSVRTHPANATPLSSHVSIGSGDGVDKCEASAVADEPTEVPHGSVVSRQLVSRD